MMHALLYQAFLKIVVRWPVILKIDQAFGYIVYIDFSFLMPRISRLIMKFRSPLVFVRLFLNDFAMLPKTFLSKSEVFGKGFDFQIISKFHQM